MEAQFLTSTPSQEIDIHLYPMLRLVLMLIIGISLGYSFYASIPCYVWAFLLLTSLLTSLFLSRKKLGQSLCVFALLVSLGGFWASFSYSKLGTPALFQLLYNNRLRSYLLYRLSYHLLRLSFYDRD